jgi:hypothetical protein
LPFALGEVNTMPTSIEVRLAVLEKAAHRAEGSQFAVHDLMAQVLARLPAADLNALVASLTSHAAELDADLGPDRLAGYRDELASIAEEVAHVRGDAQGLLARLARVVGANGGGGR